MDARALTALPLPVNPVLKNVLPAPGGILPAVLPLGQGINISPLPRADLAIPGQRMVLCDIGKFLVPVS